MQPGMQPGMQPMMPTQPTQPTQPGGGGRMGVARLSGSITMGATIAGALEQGDNTLEDQSLGDDYSIMLMAGVPVTIVVRGGPRTDQPGQMVDSFAMLGLNGTTLATNDDIDGSNLNSRIVFTPTTTAMHTLRVSTAGSGLKMGSYTVTVMPGANPMAL